ncbi:SID1 transmembrane family member 1-like isoform X1, partial [Biomphalaria pfeifferi]
MMMVSCLLQNVHNLQSDSDLSDTKLSGAVNLANKNSGANKNNKNITVNASNLDLEIANLNFNLSTSIVSNCSFGTTYSDYVNISQQIIFIYNYLEENKTTAVRVTVTSSNATEAFPTMFVARQQEGILSWQIPFEIGSSYSFWSVSRTLCPIDKSKKKTISKSQLIYITVSSMWEHNVHFTLTTNRVTDFELDHEKPRTFNLSVWQPTYFMYTFPENVSTILLKVTSASHICMTVSVQNIKCPVFDLETNVEFEGKHQTMTTQAAMFLEKDDFKEMNGFYVVFIVKPSNEVCEGYLQQTVIGPSNETDSKKTVTMEIKGTISGSQYLSAILGAIGFYLIFYVIAFIIGIVFAGCGLHKGLDELTQEEIEQSCYLFERSMENVLATPGNERRSISSQPNESYGSICASTESSGDSLDESSIDFLHDASIEKEIVRTKTALFVSDLARKKRKKLAKSYRLYHWNLITIAIFYGLPVVQLVITYQRVLTSTGNQDLCYYNFACSHPLENYLSSFNNVFSNIGYIMLGLLFIVIVYRRDVLHKKILRKHGKLEKLYGIPQHFGLFYAMGLALFMEGIMSACYHVCPNYTNFQFDTSFMYIIACLNMLKIYQSRHPDINAKAHTAYFSMAVIIFIAVLGVVYGTNIFWILYALIHMLVTLVLTAQVYYMGRWNIDCNIFRRIWRLVITEGRKCTNPVYPSRFTLLLIGNIINWVFALYGAIKQPSDFATYLLAIFIGNLLLYCIFYIIMKLLYKEHLNWLVKIVICTSVITWAGSLYFFFQNLTSWS